MNLIQRIIPITAMIALAIPGVAADEVAKELEKQAIGYWAPDTKAMTRIFTEQMGLGEEDAAQAVAEFAKLTVHVEMGTAHIHSEHGMFSQQYEVLEADKDTGTLTLRALSPPDAPKPQAVKIAIKDDQITVTGMAVQVPLVLRKINEDEFLKRKAALPAQKVGP